MKNLFLIITLLIFTGCAASGERVSSLFDRLEFGPCETGEISMQGDVSVGGGVPLFGSTVNVMYRKSKNAVDEDCREVEVEADEPD